MNATVNETAPSAISNKIEDNVADEPVNANIRTGLLFAAGGALVVSLVMQTMERKHEALFIGQWVPTLISIALWYQIVKEQHGR